LVWIYCPWFLSWHPIMINGLEFGSWIKFFIVLQNFIHMSISKWGLYIILINCILKELPFNLLLGNQIKHHASIFKPRHQLWVILKPIISRAKVFLGFQG